MKVLVGLYRFNTQWHQQRSLATRLLLIEDAIDSFKSIVDVQVPTGQMLRAVFLAPEYMFSRALAMLERDATGFHAVQHGDHRRGDRRQMEQEEADKVEETIKRLSEGFPDALLIPGTAAWREKLPARGTTARSDAVLGFASDIMKASPINCVPLKDRAPLHWPVYPAQVPKEVIHTPYDKLGELVNADYVAHNTAYCYFNGECLFKYNKIGDFHEVFHERKDGPDTVHIPSLQPGRFDIPLSSIKVGISICYDQSLTNFEGGQARQLQSTAEPVQIHVLLSACIEPNLQLANLERGGYLLSCSSHDAFNRVACNGAAAPDPVITPTLKIFTIEVSDEGPTTRPRSKAVAPDQNETAAIRAGQQARAKR